MGEAKNGKLKTFLRTERDKLRPMTKKERRQYLWEYYKLPALLTVVILFFAVWILTAMIGGWMTKPSLYCIVSTGSETSCEDYFLGYDTYRGFGKHRQVDVNSGHTYGENDAGDYSYQMVYSAALTNNTADTVICNQATLDYLLQTDSLSDLSVSLTGSAAELASSRLVYSAPNGTETVTYTAGTYAVDITDTQLGREIANGGSVYFTIPSSCTRTEEVQTLLAYILQS